MVNATPCSLYFVVESSKRHALASVRVWRTTLQSMFRWNDVEVREEERGVAVINSGLQQYGRSQVLSDSGCPFPLFRPYVAKVPWHKGARAFLSQAFPRYGHYCGPKWSSGKDDGSMVWDRRYIDWLDFCCYCHDIGYDTRDQMKLHKADLAFLECLEKPRMKNRGDAHIAHIYRTMCMSGLRYFLIPYGRRLVKQQANQPFFQWLGNLKLKNSLFQQA